jgi:hypothetical protein
MNNRWGNRIIYILQGYIPIPPERDKEIKVD